MKKRHLPRKNDPKKTRPFPNARENGRLGGQVRADTYTPNILSEWATMGGMAVINKYGPDYFREIRELRTNYPRREEPPAPAVISRRVVSGRENGKRGGLARALKYSRAQLRKWARRGGLATRDRHGPDFYRKIRKKRTQYPKGYITQKTKAKQKALYTQVANSAGPMSALWRLLAKE